MSLRIEKFIKTKIDRLKADGLHRELTSIAGPIDTKVSVAGTDMILLSSNNYLGLACHPKLKEFATLALTKYGTGAGASRLVAGNMRIHQKLEEKIASFKECSSAVLFSTGYMANIGVITSLAGEGDLILSDSLNHASIIDGCRLSGAKIKIYPHMDTKALYNIIKKECKMQKNGYNKRFIITDGIFSMDGDIAPLPELMSIADKFNAMLIVDDAHATGVLGKNGKGTSSYFGIKSDNLIQIGTFSKALGSLGGYVVGHKLISEYIQNKARSFIYSTALPPGVCAASLAAIDLLEQDPSIQQQLWQNVEKFRNGLIHLGFDTINSRAHIIPVLIRDTDLTMKFSKALFNNKILAPGIRPPTVSDKMSRIRVSLMASHKPEQIDMALNVFKTEGKRLGII